MRDGSGSGTSGLRVLDLRLVRRASSFCCAW